MPKNKAKSSARSQALRKAAQKAYTTPPTVEPPEKTFNFFSLPRELRDEDVWPLPLYYYPQQPKRSQAQGINHKTGSPPRLQAIQKPNTTTALSI